MSSTVWYEQVEDSPLRVLSTSAEDAVLFQARGESTASVWASCWVTAGLRVVLSATECDSSPSLPAPFDDVGNEDEGTPVVVETENVKTVMAQLAAAGVSLGKGNRYVEAECVRSIQCSGHSAGQRATETSTTSMPVAEHAAQSLPTVALLLGGTNSTSRACCCAVVLTPVLLSDKRDRLRVCYHATVYDALPHAELVCLSRPGDWCLVFSTIASAAVDERGASCQIGTALHLSHSGGETAAASGAAPPPNAARAKLAQVVPLQWENPHALPRLRRGHGVHWVWGLTRHLEAPIVGTAATTGTTPQFDVTLMEAHGQACHFRATPLLDGLTISLRDVTKVKMDDSRSTSYAHLARANAARLPYAQNAGSLSFASRWCQSPWLAEALADNAHRLQQQREAFDVIGMEAARAQRTSSSITAPIVLATSRDGRVALCHTPQSPAALFLAFFEASLCSSGAAAYEDASLKHRRSRHSGDRKSARGAVAVSLPPCVTEAGANTFEDAVFVATHGMQGFLCVYRRVASLVHRESTQDAAAAIMWVFVPLGGMPHAVLVEPAVPLSAIKDAQKVLNVADRLLIVHSSVSDADVFGDAALDVRLGSGRGRLVLRASVTLPTVASWLAQCYLSPLSRGAYQLGAVHAVDHLRSWMTCGLLSALANGSVGEVPTRGTDDTTALASLHGNAAALFSHLAQKAVTLSGAALSPSRSAVYAPLCAAAQLLHDVLAPMTDTLALTGSGVDLTTDATGASTALVCVTAVFQAVGACARCLQHTSTSTGTPVPFTALAAPLAECVEVLAGALEALVAHGATSTVMACLGPLMWSGTTTALELPAQKPSAVADATCLMSWRCVWAPLFDLAYPLTLSTTSPLAERETLLPYCTPALQEVDSRSHQWAREEAAQRTITDGDGTALPLLGWASKEPSASEVLTAMRSGDTRDVRTLSLEHVLHTARRFALEAGPSAAAEYLRYFTCHDGCHASLVKEWHALTALDSQTRSLLLPAGV